MAVRMIAAAAGRWGREWRAGQMTVELMAVLPVAIAIAVIAVNALTFFVDCAKFDRVARNAVCVQAASPGYGVQSPQSQANIAAAVQEHMEGDFEQVSAEYEGTGGGLVRYVVTLDYTPNLFGMGARDSVFGVMLPHLRHSTSLVIDPYKPGVFFE